MDEANSKIKPIQNSTLRQPNESADEYVQRLVKMDVEDAAQVDASIEHEKSAIAKAIEIRNASASRHAGSSPSPSMREQAVALQSNEVHVAQIKTSTLVR